MLFEKGIVVGDMPLRMDKGAQKRID